MRTLVRAACGLLIGCSAADSPGRTSETLVVLPVASIASGSTSKPATPTAPGPQEVAAFASRFLDAIELNDVDRWLSVLTNERRQRLRANPDVARLQLDAWRSVTLPMLYDLRDAQPRVEPLTEGSPTSVVRFKTLSLPGDPSSPYEVRVAFEDGELRVDEN